MTDAKNLLSKFINEIATTFAVDSSVQRYSIDLCKRYADQLNAHYNFPVLSADQDGAVDDGVDRNGGMQKKSTMHEVNLSPLPRLKRGRQVHQRDNKQHQLSFDMGKSSVSNYRPSPRRTPPHDHGDPLKVSTAARNTDPNAQLEHHNRCSSYGNINPRSNFNFEVASQITTADSVTTTADARFPLCGQGKSATISDRSTALSLTENKCLHVEIQPRKLPDKDVTFSTPSSGFNLQRVPIDSPLEGRSNNPHAAKMPVEDDSNGYIPRSHMENNAKESTNKSPASKADSRKKHNRTKKIENLDLSTSAKVTESSEETQSESKIQRISKKTLPPNSKENFLSAKHTRMSTETNLHFLQSDNSTASDNGMFVLNVVDIATPPPSEIEVENPTKPNSKDSKPLQTRESNVSSHQNKSLQVKMDLHDTSTKSLSHSMPIMNSSNDSEMENKAYTTTGKVAFLRMTDRLPGAVPPTAPPEDITPDFYDDFADGETSTKIEFHTSQELSPTLTSVDVFYKHEQLIAPGPYPAGICIRKREIYLAEDEFKKILGVSRSAWDSLPRWKQEQRKRAAKLF